MDKLFYIFKNIGELFLCYLLLAIPFDFAGAWVCEYRHEWAEAAYRTAQCILEILIVCLAGFVRILFLKARRGHYNE